MKPLAVPEKLAQTFSSALIHWWDSNKRSFSWRKTHSRYELLMAEILLRRTNAAAVQKIYPEFLKKFPSSAHLAAADRQEILQSVKSLGLNWRAENIVALAERLSENRMEIPDDLENLQDLPGVGSYVARAVLINSKELRAVAVDSNVVRVLCRYLGIEESDSLRRNKEFQNLSDELISDSNPREFNYALLDLASKICRRRKPLCSKCPLEATCEKKGL